MIDPGGDSRMFVRHLRDGAFARKSGSVMIGIVETGDAQTVKAVLPGIGRIAARICSAFSPFGSECADPSPL